MTEEELKKSMTKVFIVVAIMLVLMIILSVIVFNKFGKNPSVFENENQRKKYENMLEEKNVENITENDIKEIDNTAQNNVVNEIVE